MSLRGTGWLLLLLVLAAIPAGAQESETQPPGTEPVIAADHQLLEEIYEEEKISTEDPLSFTEYIASLWARLGDRLAVALASSALALPVAWIILWVLVIGVVVWLAVHLVSLLAKRRRSGTVRESGPELDPLEEVDSTGDLRRRLEEEISRGDARAALRTLWLLVARELHEKGVGRFEPEVTHREFVTSVGRTAPGFGKLDQLGQLARSCDWLLYSRGTIDLKQVLPLRSLAREILS